MPSSSSTGRPANSISRSPCGVSGSGPRSSGGTSPVSNPPRPLLEHHVRDLVGAHDDVLQQRVERGLVLERRRRGGIDVEHDRTAVLATHAGRDPRITPPRAMDLRRGLRLPVDDQALDEDARASAAGTTTTPRAVGGGARELHRTIRRVDAHTEQTVATHRLVEERLIQPARTVQLGQEPRVVEEPGRELGFDLRAGLAVRSGRGHDRLLQRGRLVPEQRHQLLPGRPPVEPDDGQEPADEGHPGPEQRACPLLSQKRSHVSDRRGSADGRQAGRRRTRGATLTHTFW